MLLPTALRTGTGSEAGALAGTAAVCHGWMWPLQSCAALLTLATVPTSSDTFWPRRVVCLGKMLLYSSALPQLMLYAVRSLAENQSSTYARINARMPVGPGRTASHVRAALRPNHAVHAAAGSMFAAALLFVMDTVNTSYPGHTGRLGLALAAKPNTRGRPCTSLPG